MTEWYRCKFCSAAALSSKFRIWSHLYRKHGYTLKREVDMTAYESINLVKNMQVLIPVGQESVAKQGKTVMNINKLNISNTEKTHSRRSASSSRRKNIMKVSRGIFGDGDVAAEVTSLCSKCPEVFKSVSECHLHEKCHGDEVHCTVCRAGFDSSDNLLSHVDRCHHEDEFNEEEGEVMVDVNDLKQNRVLVALPAMLTEIEGAKNEDVDDDDDIVVIGTIDKDKVLNV